MLLSCRTIPWHAHALHLLLSCRTIPCHAHALHLLLSCRTLSSMVGPFLIVFASTTSRNRGCSYWPGSTGPLQQQQPLGIAVMKRRQLNPSVTIFFWLPHRCIGCRVSEKTDFSANPKFNKVTRLTRTTLTMQLSLRHITILHLQSVFGCVCIAASHLMSHALGRRQS